MIAEALLYETARADPAGRRLGLVGDAVALWSRATRRRRSWRVHEERCRAFVSSMVPAGRGRTVLVLGSGLLRDIPAERLAEAFERVVLVDAVHLWPARRVAGRLRAELHLADLSGAAGSALLASWAATRTVDLVVSANLLSQMPLAHRRRAGDWEGTAIANRIAARHLSDLAGLGCPVCLLSDVGYRDVGPDGRASSETALVDETLLPPADESWDWEVAPVGEIGRDFARVHRVGAWRLPPAASLPRPAPAPLEAA